MEKSLGNQRWPILPSPLADTAKHVHIWKQGRSQLINKETSLRPQERRLFSLSFSSPLVRPGKQFKCCLKFNQRPATRR